MGRPHKRMNIARRSCRCNRCLWLALTDHSTSFIKFDRLPRSYSSRIMTSKIAVVRNATVVNESLSAGEVVSSTVQTDQLDHDAIRLSTDDHGTGPLFRCRIAVRQGLQFRATARATLRPHCTHQSPIVVGVSTRRASLERLLQPSTWHHTRHSCCLAPVCCGIHEAPIEPGIGQQPFGIMTSVGAIRDSPRRRRWWDRSISRRVYHQARSVAQGRRHTSNLRAGIRDL